MFDRLAACKQSKKRTCLDLFLYHDVKISKRYQVKPENSHFSFEVYCRFPKHENNDSIIMQNIRTLVHHDSEIEMLVQTGKVLLCPWSLFPSRPKKNHHNKMNMNNPLNNAAIHRRQITYDVGLKSIKALISDSKQCRQLVHWRCKLGTPFLFEDNQDSVNHLISHWITSEGRFLLIMKLLIDANRIAIRINKKFTISYFFKRCSNAIRSVFTTKRTWIMYL